MSRDTIVRAYRKLSDIGLVETDGTKGTYVCHREVIDKSRHANVEVALDPGSLSPLGRLACAIATPATSGVDGDFALSNFGAVPSEALPIRRWRETLQRRTKLLQQSSLSYGVDVFGRPELRASLSNYLAHAKGLNCSVSDLAVFNISLSAVSLMFRLLLEKGALVAVEDPGFLPVRQLIALHNLRLLPVSVDREGLMVDVLRRSPEAPRLVYVTPSHHDPTGATMSLRRRQELLSWARQHSAWIIEDDYDGFYNVNRYSHPSLKAMDDSGRVLYLSTFWQVLYPLATTSFIVLPPGLSSVVEKAKALSDGIAEPMLQLVLSDLLDSGFLTGHIRRWDGIFSSRRRALIYNLKHKLGTSIEIEDRGGGLSCLVDFPEFSSGHVLLCSRRSNLPVLDIVNRFYQAGSHRYLIYFCHLSERQIASHVAEFARELLS